MSITHTDVAALAASVEARPSGLLTGSNPKTAKGEGYGYLTGILHLAPSTASGANLCAAATAGCIAACLNTAGRGGFDARIQRARIRKSKWFRADRDAFMQQLERDIRKLVRDAARHGLIPAVRLNGTSDIPWENVAYTAEDGTRVRRIMDRFPDVQFYDYTKIATRFARPLPANYDLTFSWAETEVSQRGAELAFRHGARVAVVMRNAQRPRSKPTWALPAEHDGRTVVDADKHDLRFLEPSGVWCGLRAKGLAKVDTSGFVVDVTPAAA